MPPPPRSTLFPYTTLFRSHSKMARLLYIQLQTDLTALRHIGCAYRFDSHAFFCHRSEEHTSELQSRFELVCRLLLEKKNRRNASSITSSPAACSTCAMPPA